MEELLVDKAFNEDRIKENAASIAAKASNPIDDMHGPADWKRELVKVHVYRILKVMQQHYLK